MFSKTKITTKFYFAVAVMLQVTLLMIASSTVNTVTAISTYNPMKKIAHHKRGQIAKLEPIEKNTGAWLNSLAHCAGGKTCLIWAAPTCEEAAAHGIDISSASSTPGGFNIQVMNAALIPFFMGWQSKIQEAIPRNQTTSVFHVGDKSFDGVIALTPKYAPQDANPSRKQCSAMTSSTQYKTMNSKYPYACVALTPNPATGSSCVVNLVQVAQMSTPMEKYNSIANKLVHQHTTKPTLYNPKEKRASKYPNLVLNKYKDVSTKCRLEQEDGCAGIWSNRADFKSKSDPTGIITATSANNLCLSNGKRQCNGLAKQQDKLDLGPIVEAIKNSKHANTGTNTQAGKYKTLATTLKTFGVSMDIMTVSFLGKTAKSGWNKGGSGFSDGAGGSCASAFGRSMEKCVASALKTFLMGEVLGEVITPATGALMTAVSYGITDSKTYATASAYVPKEFKSIHNFGSTQLNIAKVSGEFAGVDFGACLASSLVRLSGCEDTDDLDEDTDQTEESDLENAENEMVDNVEEDSTDLESGELDAEAPEVEVEGAGDGVADGVGDGVADGVGDGVADGVGDGVGDGVTDAVVDTAVDTGVDVAVDTGVEVGVEVVAEATVGETILEFLPLLLFL